jgi:hypothetical protein
VAFDEYLQMRNPAEGQHWVETALALADARVPARVRAEALPHRAMHLNDRSAWASAEATALENLALCEELDDAHGRSVSLADLAWAGLVGLVLGGRRPDVASYEQQRHEVADIARKAVAWARRARDDVVLASALTVNSFRLA